MLKRIAQRITDRLIDYCRRKLDPIVLKNLDSIRCIDRTNQIRLLLKYRDLHREKKPLPEFGDVEFRSFSQNGEDGILLYIFSIIGTGGKSCIEICAGDGIECNTANLIINHGFYGTLFDGDKDKIDRGIKFYSRCKDTFTYPPKLLHAWITKENINQLIAGAGLRGEIDLLSLDMDGMDYWVWKEIDCIKPRVVVLEYNNLWPADKSVAVPYDPNFRPEYTPCGVDYGGASLLAFVKLGKIKGYRLIGCQRYGFNAFFLRNGIGEDAFPEVLSSACLPPPYARLAIQERSKNIIHKPWVEV